MAIPIPDDVRQLLEAPNYAHLSTLRADGSPRNWVVWVGVEGDHILVYTSRAIWKAKDMLRDPRVALSVNDMANPYRMAAIQGRVVEVRPRRGLPPYGPDLIQVHERALRGPGQGSRVLRDRGRESGSANARLVHNPG